MDILDIIGLLFSEQTAAAIATAFLVLKGVASVVANNFDTQEWGKVGQVIDWLASNDKKAKLTGDFKTDGAIKDVLRKVQPVGKVFKVLKLLS